jgi:hypothetical protein
MPKQPPNVNGLAGFCCEFLEDGTNNPNYDAAKVTDIQNKLTAIQTAFVETDDVPICDTFYLTANYNKENPGNEINGDTAQYILSLLNPSQEG